MQNKLKPYLETLLNLRASLAQDINQMEDNSVRDHAKTLSIPTDNEELGSDHAEQELTLTLLESDGALSLTRFKQQSTVLTTTALVDVRSAAKRSRRSGWTPFLMPQSAMLANRKNWRRRN